MISKRKIAAMVLFLLMSLFMFAFANPGPTTELGEAPVITVDPELVKIIEGTDYDVMTGVSVTDDRDTLTAEADLEDTTALEIGEHEVTYTATDSDGNQATATRTIKVLDPDADEDGDGYTNQEEEDNGSDFDDPDSRPTDRAPIVRVIPASVKILLGDNYPILTGVTVFDDFDDVTVSADMATTVTLAIGDYTIRYTSSADRLGRTTTVTRALRVLDPNADEDGDGYTNGEEDNAGTDYDDVDEFPDYDKAPTITLDESNIYRMEVYGDIPEFDATATDVHDGIVPVVITHNIDKNVVGVYKVTFKSVDSLGNEKIIERDFTVVRRKITVTIDNKTSVYGSSILSLTYQVTSGMEVFPGADITLLKATGLDAGSYEITGNYENNQFDVTFINGTYTITAKTLEESDLGDYAFVDGTFGYNGTEHKIEVTGLPVWASVSYDDNTRTNAGTQEVTATISGGLNYSGTVTAKADLTVTKAAVTVTADDKTSVYGDALEALTSTTTGTVYGSDGLNIGLSKPSGLDVGTYTITVSANNSNYDITLVNGTYTITKKTLEESDLGDYAFVDGTFGYNGTEHKIEVTGLPVWASVSYDDNTRTNAGTQEVTATISGGLNYSGTVTAKADLTVTKAAVTVTADDKTSVYGDALEALTSTTTGTVYGSDGLNIGLSKPSGLDVGTYTITVSANNSNYDITLVNGTYTITKKTLEESDLGDYAFVDGTFGYNGTEHKIEVTGLPVWASVSYDDNTRTNAGTQEVTATISGGLNYSGTVTAKADLTVTKAAVTVTADDKTSVYGDALEALTSTTTGMYMEVIV
jgi:head-tail adaptor